MGINVAALGALMDDFYYLIIAVAGLIGAIFFLRGWMLLKYAVQMGGMNSMGTRSFYSESAIHIFCGLLLLYFSSYVTNIGVELFSAQFDWNNESTSTTGLYAFGAFVIQVIKLFGVFLLLKGILSLTDKEGGSIKKFVFTSLFGLLAMYIDVVSNELGRYTGFNPLALFIPGTSVMSL
jgi:hypothetical protein